MKRRDFIFFALLLCYFHGFGQNRQVIDKLKQQLFESKNKEQQFQLLTSLAWEYRTSQHDSSIYFANKAYALGEAMNMSQSLAIPLNYIGLAHSHAGDHLNAFQYFNRAASVAASQSDSLELAHAFNNIGRLFNEQGLIIKARPYLNQSLAIFSSLNDSSGMAYVYQSLGASDKLLSDFTSSENNYRKAYDIRTRLNNKRDILTAMVLLGKLYLDQGKNDEAISYFKLADTIGTDLEDKIAIAEVETLWAECLINKGELIQAEVFCSRGLDYILDSSNRRLLPSAYLTMGRIQFKKGEFTLAKQYFEKALKISTMRKDLNMRMEAHFFLWQTYRQQNNKREELISYNQYLLVKDSLHTLELIQKEQKFKFEMEIERRQQENELLKAQEARQNAVIIILMILFGSASWLLFAQWKHRKRIQRFNLRLEERNAEIKKINGIINLKNATLENHINTLVKFSRNHDLIGGKLAKAAHDIVRITSQSLQIGRVSIWLYHENKQLIESMVCYEAATNSFLPSTILPFTYAPIYFGALKKEKIIVADNAATHPYTKEFAESYLPQHGIRSMLDSIIFLDGELKGLLCCEHLDTLRTWTAEDIIFVSSVADIISLAFRAEERAKYEQRIEQHTKQIEHMNEVLEERVKERTEELNIQNQRLVEYAFINSHLLRGPLSRILGLINLMEHDHTMQKEDIISLLRRSGTELDSVVRKITDTLQQGGHLTRDDLTAAKD